MIREHILLFCQIDSAHNVEAAVTVLAHVNVADDVRVLRTCVCVRACVCVCTHTHTYEHTYIHTRTEGERERERERGRGRERHM